MPERYTRTLTQNRPGEEIGLFTSGGVSVFKKHNRARLVRGGIVLLRVAQFSCKADEGRGLASRANERSGQPTQRARGCQIDFWRLR